MIHLPLLTKGLTVLYPSECLSIYHRDTGVRNIDDFVHRVDKLSIKYVIGDGITEEENALANKFKGDQLEIFSEIFFGAHRNDRAVGIHNYSPIPLSEDYGVDATGINMAGNPVVIQCKFRSNPSDAITYEDMAKTFTSGIKRHHIPLGAEVDDTVILLTTCNSVNKYCKEVFGSQLRLISKSIIGQRIVNNLAFWEEAEQRVVLTLQKLGLLSRGI